MKKILLSVFLTLFLVACGTTDLSDDYKEENEVKAEDILDENSEEKEEEPEIIATFLTVTDEDEIFVDMPLVRTEKIERVPWCEYPIDEILNRQENGETVFLFSDADRLERDVLYVAQGNDAKTKRTYAQIIRLFEKEVSQYAPGKQEYFEILLEVREKLLDGNDDEIPDLIEKAKRIREE